MGVLEVFAHMLYQISCAGPLFLVSACSYAPCLNGGKCTNVGLTDYTCSCPTRYTGENCTLGKNQLQYNLC